MIKEYRGLIEKGGFTTSPQSRQAAVDFILRNAPDIDFDFEDPDELFELIKIMLDRDDARSFKILLNSGYGINTVNAKFETVFTKDYTWFYKKLDFIKAAREAGADFTKRNKSGKNFFSIAFSQITEDGIKDYLFSLPEFDNEKHQVQYNGKLLFHLAVDAGNRQSQYTGKTSDLYTVRKFIDSGFDVDTPYSGQEYHFSPIITQRAIHLACENLSTEAVKLLLQHGADPLYPTSDGRTPIDIVLERDKRGGHVDVRGDTKKVRQQLLDAIAEFIPQERRQEALTKCFFNMMTQASTSANRCFFAEEIAIKLLNMGAAVDRTADDGTTALHMAARCGNFEIYKACVKAGLDINAKNNNGDTPVLLAAAARQDKIIMSLIKLGADTDAVNLRGDTVLDILTKHGNAPLIEYMLDKAGSPRGQY